VFNFYQINKNNEIRTCDHFVIKTDTILKKLIQLKKIKKLNKIIKYNLYYLGEHRRWLLLLACGMVFEYAEGKLIINETI
jgi:hypothetical protein